MILISKAKKPPRKRGPSSSQRPRQPCKKCMHWHVPFRPYTCLSHTRITPTTTFRAGTFDGTNPSWGIQCLSSNRKMNICRSLCQATSALSKMLRIFLYNILDSTTFTDHRNPETTCKRNCDALLHHQRFQHPKTNYTTFTITVEFMIGIDSPNGKHTMLSSFMPCFT